MSQLKTLEDFVEFATEKGFANPEERGAKMFADKQADDKIYFNGNAAELKVLFVKQKRSGDIDKLVADTLAKRKQRTTNKRSDEQHRIYSSGTLDEIKAYVKANVKDVKSLDAYAGKIFAGQTQSLKERAAELGMSVGKPAFAGKETSDDFDTLLTRDYVKVDKKTGLARGVEDQENFVRNIIKKLNRDIVDNGSPEELLTFVTNKLRTNRPEAYTAAILKGRPGGLAQESSKTLAGVGAGKSSVSDDLDLGDLF